MVIRKIFSVLVTACSMLLAWSPMPASAVGTELQEAHNLTGNQDWFGGVGVKFNVNSPVSVSALGIYDSNLDGIFALQSAPLSAYLLTSAGGFVASVIFDSVSQGAFLDFTSHKSLPVQIHSAGYSFAGNICLGWVRLDYC